MGEKKVVAEFVCFFLGQSLGVWRPLARDDMIFCRQGSCAFQADELMSVPFVAFAGL